MDEKSIIEKFLNYEPKLFHIQPQGVPIWEWMRTWVFRDIIDGQNIQNHSTGTQNMDTYFRAGYLWLRNAILRNPFCANQHEYLFFTGGRRQKQSDGLWWDKYTDPILTEANFDYLEIENNHNQSHYTPARTKNLRYIDFIQYTDTIKRRAGLVDITFRQDIKEDLREANRELKHLFDVDVNLLEKARHYMCVRKSRRPLYKRFLSRIKPQVVVLVCSYSKQTFIEVCKDKDIPVAELQHSLINDEHMGYRYPSNQKVITFPDYFLSWGEFWEDTAKFPIPDNRVITVGYPYLNQSINRYSHIDSKQQILFISQSSIGEELSRFALRLSRRSEITHDIVYKLHPSESDDWEDRYPWLINSDIRIISGSDPPLYQLFSESRVQVGVYSTALYEGICFNLETYLYDCTDSVLQSLVNEGIARKISSADQFIYFLDDKSNNCTPSSDIEQFFYSGDIKNTIQIIKDLKNNAHPHEF